MAKYLNMSLALLTMDILYDIMCYAISVSLPMFVCLLLLIESVLRAIVCTSAQAMSHFADRGSQTLLTFRFFLYILLKLRSLIILS